MRAGLGTLILRSRSFLDSEVRDGARCYREARGQRLRGGRLAVKDPV
jgi:hypothetical protein